MLLDDCWPYLAIFGTLFFTGIGIPPLPEELPIIAAGVAANRQEIIWWVVWPVCIFGIVLADISLYGAGRFWGNSMSQWRWVKRLVSPERREDLEDGFRRHGVKILLTSRLLPGFRTGAFLMAGTMRYPFIQFLLVDGLSAIISVGLVFFGSYLLTESFTLMLGEVDRARSSIVVILLALVVYSVVRLRRKAVEP